MVSQPTANAVQSTQDLRDNVQRGSDVAIRTPVAEDAAAISHLIARCPPLDRNSLYATLLLCTHFSATCAVTFRGERAAGWVSAYIPPAQPDTLFVWQVAVAPEQRGSGLARRLIADIVSRPVCRHIRRLQTTITTDNAGSWSLFRRVAAGADAKFYAEPHFLRGTHFNGDHETEHMVTIGPFNPSAFCGEY